MGKQLRISSLSPEQLMLFKKKVKERNISVLQIPIERNIGEKKEYPLSLGQERLWFVCQLEENSSIYNLYNVIKVTGHIDSNILEKSINILVQRHESLRTAFMVVDGKPYQQILDNLFVPLTVMDLSDYNDEERQKKLDELLLNETGYVFDLSCPPLIKTVLYKLDSEHYVFLLNIHHIISDGWSIQIITQELIEIYSALCNGQQIQLKELPIRYVDYASWQREWFQDEFLERELDFWEKSLKGAPSFFSLPTDFPRPSIQTYSGDILHFRVERALLDKLRILSKKNGVSLYTTMLAAFKVLLFKYTGAENIVIGTPTAGRYRTETEGVVGFFANSLIINTKLSGSMKFNELLKLIARNTTEAIDNQNVPFEKMIELVNPMRDLSYSPLFQIFFIFQNRRNSSVIDRVLWEPMEFSNKLSKFDITLEITEMEDYLRASIEYNTDLYLYDTINNFSKHYINVLETITQNDEVDISHLEYMSKEEYDKILNKWNQTFLEIDFKQTVHGLFEEQVKRTPIGKALVFKDKIYTYEQVDRNANKFAVFLKKQGIRPGMIIGVHMEPEPELVFVLLGILKAGCAYVPIDPSYPKKRTSFIIKNSCMELVVVNSSGNHSIPDNVRIIDASASSEIWLEDDSNYEYNSNLDTSMLAYIMYTSGSTGYPKGVRITHMNVVNFLSSMKKKLGIKETDRFFSITTYSFDISVLEIFLPLVSGACVIQIEKGIAADGAEMQRRIEMYKPTIMQGTPAFWRMLITSGWKGNSELTVLCGGEELKKDLAEMLVQRCKCLWNMYGPTETTVWSLMEKINGENSIITIGKPIHNTKIYILDDKLKVVPPGVIGDLYIGGLGVSEGYNNDEDQTRKRFVLNPYKNDETLFFTGDKAKYLSDGRVMFCGRKDHQLKIRGFRIEPAEIENRLNKYRSIENSVVIGIKDSSGEYSLTAFIKLENGIRKEAIDLSDLRKYLREELPEYMIPSRFAFVHQFPLTPNLKIDRKKLMEIPLDEVEENIEDQMPRNETEKRLAKIWMEVLTRKSIGIYDNFFDLGGHSILAVSIIAKTNNEFEASFPLRWIFQYPTIASFAAEIDKYCNDFRTYPNMQFPSITIDYDNLYDSFPLTEVQMAYWAGRNSQLGLGSISTHIYQEVEIENLDLRRFSEAFNKVIRRHHMLRAVITSDGRQRILENVPVYEIKTHNLKGTSEEEKRLRLEAVRQELSHQVLKDSDWPLFDVQASILDDELTRLHISFDLLIADAWSFQILLREIAYFYANPEGELQNMDISFRDYVIAYEKLLAQPIYAKAKEYWERRLDSIPPGPQLPICKNPNDIKHPQFKRWKYVMNEQQWKKLTNRLKGKNITKTVLLIACFSEILSLWSKKACFTLNLTIFNRFNFHPQINDIVGDFTTISLLEVNNKDTKSIELKARKIQEQLWNDLDNGLYSGIRVTEQLLRKGYISEPFPVVFTSLLDLNYSEKDDFQDIFKVVNQEETSKNSISQTPQVWLDHQVIEKGGELHFNWDVVEELFPQGMIDEMFDAYCKLLHLLAESDEAWEIEFPLHYGKAEFKYRKRLDEVLAKHNNVVQISGKMLHSGFVENASKYGNAIAIETSRLRITYAQLDNCSNKIGKQLREMGVGSGQLVAVVMEKCWEQIAAVLGILKAGGAYMPVDASLPADRINNLLRIGKVKVAIVCADTAEKLVLSEDIDKIVVSEEMLNVEAEPMEMYYDPQRLAYVIFTSGSTGTPKGVMIDHQGAVNTIEDINRRFGIGRRDKVFGISSLSFDLSVYDIFGTLGAGGVLVLPDSDRLRDPSHWDMMIRERGVTVWNSVPALMNMLAEYTQGEVEYETLRLVMLSGDWIPLSLPEKIRKMGKDIEVISLGGATEASIWSILYPIKEVEEGWRSIPYGISMENQRVYVMNERLEVSPVGIVGELYIGGIGVAKGYWDDEEKTAQSFIVHPVTGERLYRTGDYGRYMEDGNIEFLGRQDTQVKIGGYRIELGEIESVIRQNEYIKDAAVVVQGDELDRKHLEAYIVVDENKLVEIESLNKEKLILDPVKRTEFKLSEPAIRKDIDNGIQLNRGNDYPFKEYLLRRSYRSFQKEAIKLDSFGKFLSCLSSIRNRELLLPKYLYSSAGTLYPVQIYIYVKDGRIEGLEGGYYYYNPSRHTLSVLSSEQDAGSIHVKENRPIFDESAFSVFLVSKIDAIAPLYGMEKGKIYSYIEAGIITQHIKTEGLKFNLGFCEIGLIDFEKIRHHLKLDDSHLYLHMLLGGLVSEDQMTLEALLEENKKNNENKVNTHGELENVIENEIKKYLLEKLPDYMIPKRIFCVKSLPLSANGKIDRKALMTTKPTKKPEQEVKFIKNSVRTLPKNRLEGIIIDIWKEVLEVENIGVQDNFFDFGGNSFKIIQVHNSMKKLGLDISIVDLFRFSTVASLAEYLNQGSNDKKLVESAVSRAAMRLNSRRTRGK